MINFKKIFKGKTKGKENIKAKNEQVIHVIGFIIMGVFMYGFYTYSATSKRIIKKEEVVFDGSFDEGFTQNSDLALIEKQQSELEKLKIAEETRLKKDELIQKEVKKSEGTSAQLIKSLQLQINALSESNKKTQEQLQVAFIQKAQEKGHQKALYPQGGEAEQLKRMPIGKEIYQRKQQQAALQTIKFNYSSDNKSVERNESNYVWAGTFAEGILLNGIKADAGVNGSKNRGIGTIRLITNGNMPNGVKSRLKDCMVIVSSYGDLSGDSAVIHLETLSCAGKKINFEKKVYGAVFDTDSMQDIRGTSILNTKPLLGYTAAAGLLAGLGDGIKSIGSAQSVNSNGSVTNFGATSVARGAVGGALSNPANKISDYVMRIADIYHPLVMVRGGRKVTVQFTKGFWIDKAHQKYESGLSIDEVKKSANSTVANFSNSPVINAAYKDTEQFRALSENTRSAFSKGSLVAGQQFLQNDDANSAPLFSGAK